MTTLQDRFNPGRLIATACEEAGSDDFGADGWQPGLELLADGLVSEARLSPIGVEIAHLDLALDPEVMLSVFNGSSGRSGSTENKWPNFILPETYDSGFAFGLMVKDMHIATSLAHDLGMPIALGDAVVQQWELAAQDLAPGADHTELARWLRERSSAALPAAD